MAGDGVEMFRCGRHDKSISKTEAYTFAAALHKTKSGLFGFFSTVAVNLSQSRGWGWFLLRQTG